MLPFSRALVLCLLFTAACGDDTSGGGPKVVVRVAAEPAGAHCANGGQAVASGIDDDDDGVLDEGEVQGTQYVCSEPDAQALVRSDAEPAGEHCERGGTAVRSGLDRDRDGTLADTEVAATTYVCRDAQLEPLTRFDSEPAGEHCVGGGTAVRTGLDRDGDHALGDAEIDAIRYVCDDAELTRVVVEPAGARCLAGGAAVHSGPDRDGDGALGDAEITHTDHVCGTVIDGDVDILVQSQMDAVRDIEAITGDLTIHYASGVTSVQLPSLQVVGGDVEIHYLPAATRVEAPVLRSVTGGLRVSSIPNLTVLDLPALQDAGTIDVNDNAALATVRLPGLEYISGDVSFRRNPITELDLSSLRSTRRLSMWDLRVDDLTLPQLHTADGLDLIDATTRSFAAPSLGYVWADLLIGRNPSLATISMPFLEGIEGKMIIRGMPLLVELALPLLETLGSELDIWDNAALARLSIPKLRTIHGWFWVSGNPALESFAGLSQLYSVQDQFYFFGSRAMKDMSGLASLSYIGSYAEIGDTRLTRIGMPNLREVHAFSVGRIDAVPLADNPLLETIDLPNLRQAKSFIVTAAPQLTRFDVPALEIVNWLVEVWAVPRMRRCELEAFVQGLAVPPDEAHFVDVDESACP